MGIVGFNEVSRGFDLVQDGCKLWRIAFGDDVAETIFIFVARQYLWRDNICGIVGVGFLGNYFQLSS